jgi:dTMP kinase
MKNCLKNFYWISIEGTDGVGKTSLIKKLKKTLKNKHKNLNIIIIDEFSNSEIGKIIKSIIKKKYFFKLSYKYNLPITETLVLASDFYYQIEKIININKNKTNFILITDRGPHSFLTYQLIRLKNIYTKQIWEKWLTNIFLPLKNPDIAICIYTDIIDIKKRIKKRGDNINQKDLIFIKKTQNLYIKMFKNKKNHYLLNNKQNKLNDLNKKIINLIEKKIIKKWSN